MLSPLIVAGTGHRPPRLGLGYDEATSRLLPIALEQLRLLKETNEVTELISGMAQGWDWALAEAALQLGIPLCVAQPFVGQSSRWPSATRKAYQGVLTKAARVVVVCPGDGAGWKFIKRDHWMVDHSDVMLALWDGQPGGGTTATVDYAKSKGKRVINLWQQWELHKSGA